MPYKDPQKGRDKAKERYHEQKGTKPSAYSLLTPEQKEAQRERLREWRKRFPERSREHHIRHHRKYKEERNRKSREYREAHREELAQKRIQGRKIARLVVIAFLGGSCNVCGIRDNRVLEIHHTLGDGRKDRPGTNPGTSESYYRKILKRAQDEPGSLELVCANCHVIRHWNERNGGEHAEDHGNDDR